MSNCFVRRLVVQPAGLAGGQAKRERYLQRGRKFCSMSKLLDGHKVPEIKELIMAKSRRRIDPLAAAKSKVINPMQLGGIETSVLDNGPGRGTRIAWVNTGSPLRYKVVIDRGLDIADAFFGPHSLTWQSFSGITAPTRGLDQGLDWLRGFYGGLMVSCGPTFIGHPTSEGGEEHGLHGRHSNSAAAVDSIVSPDTATGQSSMSISGTVRTARVFGPNIELRRTISSELGQPIIKINDTFRNRGNQRVPHSWLLHINFGYPLLDVGAELLWSGTVRPAAGCESFFKTPNKFKTVPEPLAAHKGFGEAAGFITPKSNRNKMASAAVVNTKLGLAAEIRWNTREFPEMVNWQHWGPRGEYVAALEPKNGPMKEGPNFKLRRTAGQWLRPGEKKSYEVTITVHDKPSAVPALRRRVNGKK